ncbi:MAG: glycosyl hydrolase family 28-related protein [Pirellulales bacterium]
MAIMMGDSMTNGALAGSVLFVGTGPVLAQDNSNFFWNNSTQSLGIGTSSPVNDLTVRKSDTGTVGIDVINTNTTAGAANAQVFLQVAGANGGDAVTVYEVVMGARWIVGIDNSDSDKFKFVASTQSAQVCLVMTTDGKIGVTEPNPTARLHLPAGTASVAPLKLTSGTNLSSLEDGAVEWDGNRLFITSGTKRRQLAFNEVANVLDFGAPGDGSADDGPAFRAAVASLTDTGGVIWVPPDRQYVIDSEVVIRSYYPIYLVSTMGTPSGVYTGVSPPAPPRPEFGFIRPGANLATSMFRWTQPVGASEVYHGAGGGMIGVTIWDELTSSGFTRNVTIPQAVHIEGAVYFLMRDVNFRRIKGRAINVGDITILEAMNCKVHECGDTPVSAAATKVWQVAAVGPVYVDEMADFNSTANADFVPFPASEVVGDYLAIGFFQPFTKLTFDYANGTAGVGGVVAWEYWANTSPQPQWKALSDVVDNTNGFTAATADGRTVTWSPPNDWKPLSINAVNELYYYVRARVTTAYSTNPVLDQGFVEEIRPAIHIGTGTTFAGTYWDHSFCEAGYATMVVIEPVGGATFSRAYFENSADIQGFPELQNPYIDARGAVVIGDHSAFNALGTATTAITLRKPNSVVRDCRFGCAGKALDVPFAAQSAEILGNFFIGCGAGADVITTDALTTRIDGNYFSGAGRIRMSANSHRSQVNNNKFVVPVTSQSVIQVDSWYTVVNNNLIDGNDSTQGHGIDLLAVADHAVGNVVTRLAGPSTTSGIRTSGAAGTSSVMNNRVEDCPTAYSFDSSTIHSGNIADGKLLTFLQPLETELAATRRQADLALVTGATSPSVISSPAYGLQWAAGARDEVVLLSLALPENFDRTQNVIVILVVSSGTTDAATFTVKSYWDGGGAITDIATDSTPSASEHEITATIAAADVPDTAKRLSLALLPFTAHNTDPVRLFGVRIGVQMPK